MLALYGCGGKGRDAAVRGGGNAVMESSRLSSELGSDSDVVWAREGETIVVRVAPSDEAVKAGLMTLRFGTASAMAPLYWVESEIGPSGDRDEGARGHTVRDRAAAWTTGSSIAAGVLWRARRATEASARTARGFWVVAIDPVADEAPARMTLDGRTLHVGWLPEFSGASTPWTSVINTSSNWLQPSLAVVRRSPLERWRARLAAGEPLLQGPDAPDALSDRVLEGLARQEEYHWQAALERVRAIDSALSARVARQLGAVAEIDGVVLPMWSTDLGEIAALRARILTARLGDSAIVTSARAWDDGQPGAGAVVLDDAGAPKRLADDITPIVLAMNLGDIAQPVWARRGGAGVGDSSAESLEPWHGMPLTVAAPRAGQAIRGVQNPGSAAVRVSIGGRTFDRTALAGALSAAPPGVTIGPMLSDWSMPTLLAGAIESGANAPLPFADPARVTVGRLYREPGAGAPRWTIYLECMKSSATVGDAVSLHFGPSGAPLVVLRVQSSGAMFATRDPAAAGSPAGSARVSVQEDRWAVWVPVPAAAIESGKYLRLGLTRETAGEARSAWPRPMLPWQDEPGRVLIDLSAWSPLKE